MDNLFRCWSFCLKRCPCCGGNRVGPSKAVTRVVVTPPKTNKLGCCSRPKARTAPAPLLNGETNLYFQGDEVTFGVGQINSNGRCSEASPDENNDETVTSVAAEEANSEATVENYLYEEFSSILYVETGRGKQLRVVHVLSNPNPDKNKENESTSSIGQKSASLAQSSVDTTVDDFDEDDSDEEYWFTRWSRRPRLKNSFKGSIALSIGKDDPLQNSCIESRISKEIEKYQARNPVKSNGEIGGLRNPDHGDVSPKLPRKISKNSASISEELPSHTNGNGSVNSFINYGYHSEERATEIKTETTDGGGECDVTVTPETVDTQPVVAKSPDCDNGVKSQPLLFFIHGISGSSDIWKSQFEFFHSAGFEIVAPDLLGHGLSSTPRKSHHYLFESLVQDLVHVFDHFARDDRQGVIIGHGYGACLATVLSRVRPKNVCLLVSISGGGPTAMAPPAACRKPILPFNFNLFAKKGITARFDNPDLQHVLPEHVHRRLLDGQVWIDGDTAFHRRVSVPTLLIYGMRDQVVSLIEECEMERTIPRAFLELIPTAGHMVMWDEPLKLNRMILKFIQSWPY